MGNSVIIVAGGSGSRMNSKTPKQFIVLAGKPILMHTIEKFHAADPSLQIIVVLPETKFKNGNLFACNSVSASVMILKVEDKPVFNL